LFDQLKHLNEVNKGDAMSELDNVQAMWDNAKDEKPSTASKYVPVPDGDQVAVIKNAGCTQNEGKSPAVFIEMYFPKFGVNETSYNNVIANEGAIKALKSQFRGLGISPRTAHPTELDRAIKQAVGYTIKINKRTKDNPGGKPYRNYYINEVTEKPSVVSPLPVVDDTDFVPF